MDERLMDSILQSKRECYVTKDTNGLHVHHVFYGTANRKLSEKYGLKVWLRYDWHNGSNYGVHNGNTILDEKLKKAAQEKAMEVYGWTKEDFIHIFGKNYL